MKIRYRPVAKFQGYRVGDDGSVWSALEQKRNATGYGSHTVIGKKWRRLRPWTKKKTGHKIATLYRAGKQHRFPVHTLVLLAFVGPRPTGHEACHRDGNPSDNSWRNLYWGTSADNGADRRRHGRMPKGEAHSLAKLNDNKVADIWRRLRQGERMSDLAREAGVTPQCIQAINNKETWRHVTDKLQTADINQTD